MNWTYKISKSFWFQVVPAFILGPITIALFFLGIIPIYYLFFTAIMWALVSGLGIAVGYHRVLSHKTHKLPTWKENIIMFFAAFAGQGSPIFWVALHRGYHHPHTETELDIHSPIVYGKLHAFVGWYYKTTNFTNTINMKYAVDLLRKSNALWFHKHHLKILWGVPLLVAIFNWQLSLSAFCLVTFLGLLQDNLVNVFGHSKGIIGYRNFETSDNSYNNLLLGYLGWGQGWHNNHHYKPSNFDFGKSTSSKWWEWDPCNIFRPLL